MWLRNFQKRVGYRKKRLRETQAKLWVLCVRSIAPLLRAPLWGNPGPGGHHFDFLPTYALFYFSFRTKSKKPFGNSAAGSQIISTFKWPLQKRFVKKKNPLLKEKILLPVINKSYIQIQLIRRSYQSASSSPLIHFKSLG